MPDIHSSEAFVEARCHYCEQKHDVDTAGRLKPHTPPFRSDACAGSGRSPEVYFRKVERAPAADRGAVWTAYTTGGTEVGRWCEQRGHAGGHQFESVGYHQWQKRVAEGIER